MMVPLRPGAVCGGGGRSRCVMKDEELRFDAARYGSKSATATVVAAAARGAMRSDGPSV